MLKSITIEWKVEEYQAARTGSRCNRVGDKRTTKIVLVLVNREF